MDYKQRRRRRRATAMFLPALIALNTILIHFPADAEGAANLQTTEQEAQQSADQETQQSAEQTTEQSEQKTIRVGWFESEFNRLEENGYRSGYAYDYQQKLAAYTGWEYEYVEGDWYDLLKMLERGEIDLLSDVSYTEDRADEMLFSSQPMGDEEYVILVAADNEEISAENISSLNGKTVGVAEGKVVSTLYNSWAEKNGIESNVVELTETQEEQAEMLRNGEIDAIVDYSGFEYFLDGGVPLASIGSLDYYFAINKDRPELKEEIDLAMNQIFTQNRNFNSELNEKYIYRYAVSKYLTGAERDWLREHGPIRIGYRDEYYPYSGTEKGEVSGILNFFINKFSSVMRNAPITFEAIPYPTTEATVEALRKGEIDLAYPVMYGYFDAEEKELLLTDKVAESKIDAVIRESDLNEFNTTDKLRVAILEGDSSEESVIDVSYPDWEKKEYASIKDCLRAIATDEVDCFLVCDYRKDLLEQDMEKYDLTSVGIDTSAVIRFAAAQDETILCSIMNKLAATLKDLNVAAYLSQYAAKNRSVSIADFVQDHLGLVAGVLGVIIAMAALVMTYIMHVNRRLRRVNKQIDEQNEELKEYHEQLEATLEAEKYASDHDALTGLFNRRMYEEQLKNLKQQKLKLQDLKQQNPKQQDLKQGEEHSICIINMDVNGLKSINDNLGHSEGDALIRAAANAIEEAFGDIGSCFRTGGDEFEVIIVDHKVQEDELREKLKAAIKNSQAEFAQELAVSMGIAISTPEQPVAVEELLEIADAHMYADKQQYYSEKGNDRRKTGIEISKNEMANRIAELESMFEAVRIVDVEEHRALRFDENGEEHFEHMHCFDIWGREATCANCISAKALKDHGKHSKFEVIDKEIFFVTSQYVSIDGRPALLEVVQKVEVKTDFSLLDQQELIEAATSGNKQVFEKMVIPYAVYRYENNRVNTILVSDGLCELMATPREELMDRFQNDMYVNCEPQDAYSIAQAAIRFATEGGEYDVVYREKLADDEDYSVIHAVGHHIIAPNGAQIAIVTYDNITRAMDSTLRTQEIFESTARQFYENAETAISIVAQEGDVLLYTNKAFEKALPPVKAYDSGITYWKYFFGADSAPPEHVLAGHCGRGRFIAEDPVHQHPVVLNITEISWAGEKSYKIQLEDLESVYLDPLTQLANQDYLELAAADHARATLQTGRKAACIFYDIVNMKLFNSKYGYDQGDQLLKEVAKILSKVFSNALTSRLYADHFCLFTSDESLEEKLDQVEEEMEGLGGNMRIEINAGVRLVESEEDINISQMMDQAKTASDAIHDDAEKHYLYFDEKMEQEQQERKFVTDHIDVAINNGEISVYYQPVIRTSDRSLVGFEALARWISPELGFMPPSKFIPALEHSHKIHKIDCYVIEQLCIEYKKGIDKGIDPYPVSFNLSRLDFQMCDMFQYVQDMTAKYHVPHKMLCVEITETVFTEDDGLIEGAIEKFQNAGYEVWMDDFGSGYSSLNSLKDHNFDKLKIDMVFLSSFTEKSKKIIASMIQMAKAIGIHTLVEGVETEEQFEFLRDIGCEQVQGYFYGRPLPLEESIKQLYDKGAIVKL